ncbi:hypothetical protein ACWERY_27825 [Streptomyces sp. NPDC004082]
MSVLRAVEPQRPLDSWTNGERGRGRIVLPADMGGSVALKRGLGALKDFRKRVDAVLDQLEGSAGDPANVGAQRISRASFSGAGKFDEAAGLYAQYHRVHERLTALSKTLNLQIEALGIAVHGADVGFDTLEEDVRRRFWEIQTQVSREHAEAQREKTSAERERTGEQGKPEHQRSDDKTSKVGY